VLIKLSILNGSIKGIHEAVLGSVTNIIFYAGFYALKILNASSTNLGINTSILNFSINLLLFVFAGLLIIGIIGSLKATIGYLLGGIIVFVLFRDWIDLIVSVVITLSNGW
jgi:hypothetical protein